ncbi:ATP adenylyltransferase-domain-containing protein [Aspergillus pseudotamarii]|uniref:ATP adenylyltransferase-domain-containing protein n=1 Tax=Aspergillus pseudotamarii TaxID=132259 RepID=A0A5N6T2D7_ASPPS|nr:ATP adenylyltransferase-domain-containing protein [Aspergillus pseudotamarii]KAE8140458.1 ATP adenylyltransferase-domain-containing protein [Aspergillus pseudotamarii]
MNESFILSEFDRLVNSGTVIYNDKEDIIEYMDGGLKFQFLLTSALANKPTIPLNPSVAHKIDERDQKRDGSDISTQGFEIGEISTSHTLVANKFCWARPHLMLLTSDGYRRQYEGLDLNDIKSVWLLLSTLDTDYVAFYNCGQDGGCSRLHKHLQLIPTPPKLFSSFLDSKDSQPPRVPFEWFYRRLNPHESTPERLLEIYNHLLEQSTNKGRGLSTNFRNAPPNAACPHNFILTKRWMVVLPRQRAAINQEAGVNAIGMLGRIVVATQNEIDNWIRLGPTNALRELGVARQEAL